MSLTEKLMQAINGARNLWRARDPDSYAKYERDQNYSRKQADHDRHVQRDAEERTRAKDEREHDFEERYAAEHEQAMERERAKRADSL
jgi:hypothetical protein